MKGKRQNGDEYVVSYYSAKLQDAGYRGNIVEKEGFEIMQNVALDYVLSESKKSFAIQSLGCLKRFRKQLHVND